MEESDDGGGDFDGGDLGDTGFGIVDGAVFTGVLSAGRGGVLCGLCVYAIGEGGDSRGGDGADFDVGDFYNREDKGDGGGD